MFSEIKSLIKSTSFSILFFSTVALSMIHFTSPEYFKYWYFISPMLLMDMLFYNPIRKRYSGNIFPTLYISSFVLIIGTGFAAIIFPYTLWNPFFRSIYTGLILSYYLCIQIITVILSVGCIHSWWIEKIHKNAHRKLYHIYTTIAFTAGCLIFCCYLVGAFYIKNHIVVRKATIPIDNLPTNFENFRIVQISDLHLGSMYSSKALKDFVKKVNDLHPDIVAVTGDIVTLSSNELQAYIPILKQIQAKEGIFVVLGNHDYSRYGFYANIADKRNDSIALRTYIKDSLHWTLLDDEYRMLIQGNDTLAVAGTQHIGLPPKYIFMRKQFHSYGNLIKTLQHIPQNQITVLLTHSPEIWNKNIIQEYPWVNITLSGHTHGGQMGIYKNKYAHQTANFETELKGGLFQYKDQYLYINTGLGTSALHSRFMIFPEITLLTLKKRISRNY